MNEYAPALGAQAYGTLTLGVIEQSWNELGHEYPVSGDSTSKNRHLAKKLNSTTGLSAWRFAQTGAR